MYVNKECERMNEQMKIIRVDFCFFQNCPLFKGIFNIFPFV